MKKRIVHIIFYLMVSAGLVSCGYLDSGTFENDPKTWNKVFGENTPAEVTIVNSQFWKSAHFSYEFELFLEFKASQNFLDTYFINRFEMVRTTNPRFDDAIDETKPNWFSIKNLANYVIWECNLNNMVLLKNEKTGAIYLYALQV